MTHERPPRRRSTAREVFGFTEQEELSYRVSHRRFEEILHDKTTVVHEITEERNNYGEFLFVAVSRQAGDRRVCVTFFGLGHHERRERWYTDEWFWYQANPFPERLSKTIPADEAKALIDRRRRAIAAHVVNEPPSPHAQLFAMLADLTDEDAAYTELEELGDAEDWLFGDGK